MRVCVFGAGAVGGHFAARLARGGAEVCVVARGAQLGAIQARGLRVDTPDETLHAAVKASADPADLGEQDVVLVTLKAPALPQLAATIAPLLGRDTAVVFAMNGIPWWYFHREGGAHDGRRMPRIDPDDAVWRAVGPERAVGGVVYSSCTVTEPGVIQVAHNRNRLILGEPDGTLSTRTEAFAAVLQAGGLTAPVVPDIRSQVWAKLMLNLGGGPMMVLTGASGAALFEEPACQDALRAVTAELSMVATAMGWAVEGDAEAQIAGAKRLRHTSSIVQDLELGRPMEVEALFAAPLELARLAGVATPTLDLLVALAKLRARTAGLYQ